MKLKISILSIAALLTIIIFTSCGFQPIEFKNISHLKMEKSKSSGQSITATVTLFNPNNHSFEIKDLDIDVYMKQAYLGKLLIIDTVLVDKKSEFTANCQVDVARENLFVAGAAFLGSLGKKKVDISFKGSMDIKYRFLNREINIDHTEKVKL